MMFIHLIQILYQNSIFFRLLNIKNNVEDQINGKFIVGTKCRKSNSDTNIPTAQAMFSMSILAMLYVYHQRLISITNSHRS